MTERHLSHSEYETSRLGEQLAATLQPGAVVLLRGDLGAGKTAFVRGMAASVGVSSDDVSSPTFTLVQEYRGRLRLYHVDLYRVANAAEADELGLDDMSESGILAIEWAEKLARVPPGSIDVLIEDLGGDARRITIRR
jgi:tRNA threonylcarbamoyladenosine biosynthesis protein TsaE